MGPRVRGDPSCTEFSHRSCCFWGAAWRPSGCIVAESPVVLTILIPSVGLAPTGHCWFSRWGPAPARGWGVWPAGLCPRAGQVHTGPQVPPLHEGPRGAWSSGQDPLLAAHAERTAERVWVDKVTPPQRSSGAYKGLSNWQPQSALHLWGRSSCWQ